MSHPKTKYKFYGSVLKVTSSANYMDAISNDPFWNSDINYISKKTNQRLGFLKKIKVYNN